MITLCSLNYLLTDFKGHNRAQSVDDVLLHSRELVCGMVMAECHGLFNRFILPLSVKAANSSYTIPYCQSPANLYVWYLV